MIQFIIAGVVAWILVSAVAAGIIGRAIRYGQSHDNDRSVLVPF